VQFYNIKLKQKINQTKNKIMKQLFTKLTIIALSIITLNTNAQIKLGVTGGAQVSFTNTNLLSQVKNIATPTFGIVAQTNLGAGLMFRPSINYIQDGFKSVENITTQIGTGITQVNNINTTVKMQSLQIPLDVVLGMKAGNGKFLISLAPVVTIGLEAKYTENETVTRTGAATLTNSNSAPLNFSGINATFKRVDWGGKLGLGYEFKNGLQINTAYKAGLNDIAVDGGDDYKNNNLSLTLSYFFIK
jgi:Outer membrane protein beta-barrel domain